MSGSQRVQRIPARLVTPRFLEPNNIGVHRKLRDGLGQQIAAGTPRHVVKDHGQATLLSHFPVMRDQARLGWSDIWRGHHEGDVGPAFARQSSLRDALGGI